MNTPVTIPLRKLPIGIQSFEKLLIDEYDKLVWRLLVHRRNPAFLVEMLQKTNFGLREMEGIEVPSTSLNDDRANVGNPIPMIYQSGCLTIFVIIRNLDSILCRSVSSVVSKNRLFCLFHQHF